MASYVVVGASRGLGFEFVRQLSANPSNIVVGLVRNFESSESKVKAEIGRSNIHLLKFDLDDPATLTDVVAATSKITNGKLDHLIANAGIGGDFYDLSLTDLAKDPEKLEKDFIKTFRTNAIGNAFIIGAFMPLILRGDAKKVVAITSGMGETDLARNYDIWMGTAYSVSKAALNMVIAKYSAEYREKGVLVLGISPGVVNTSMNTGEEGPSAAMQELGGKLNRYEPSFVGPISPEESVSKVLSVIHNSKVDDGNAGDMISHLGTKRWV